MRQVCAGQISSHGRIFALAFAESESHADEWAYGLAKALAAMIGYAPGMRQTDFKSWPWPNPGRMALALVGITDRSMSLGACKATGCCDWVCAGYAPARFQVMAESSP